MSLIRKSKIGKLKYKIEDIKESKLGKKIMIGIGTVVLFSIITGSLSNKKQEDNKITIVVKNETTIEDLSEKLDYDIDKLLECNDYELGETIEEGTEINLNKKEIEEDEYRRYKIKKNDTKESITKNFGIKKSSLEKFDEILETDESITEAVGKKIKIYKMNEKYYQDINYSVKKGDNLVEIAKKYNTTVESIINKNELNTTIIYTNQKLIIEAFLTDEEVKELNEKQEEEVEKPDNPIEKPVNILDDYEEIIEKYGKYKGIDVAKYQGDINWKSVKKAGIDFAIIKMFDSLHIDYKEAKLALLDSKFIDNVDGCEKNNIPYGIYIYTRATTENQAKIEAEKVIEILNNNNIKPTYPIYWDIENQNNEPLKSENGESINAKKFILENPKQVIKNFKAFADVLEEKGYYVGIYSGDNCLSIIDPSGQQLKNYTIWCARYLDYKTTTFDKPKIIEPSYKGNIGILQFSSSGKVVGIKKRVDINFCKFDYHQIITSSHMNGLDKEREMREKIKVKKPSND